MKTRIKTKRLVALLLCCVMVLVMLPVTALAATADETPMPFSFKVDKTVVKGGDAVPGTETFTFELVYGTIGENDQYMVEFTPDYNVTPADCGIAFTTNTITTNGAGEQTFTLGGTVDPTKVGADYHWESSTGNDEVFKQMITFRLTEKNDGKAGWTYSDAERYLTIMVIGNEIYTDVHILGNDGSDNNFENIYTAYSFTVKKTDVDGNPLAGAVFSLTGTGDFGGRVYNAVSDENGIATFSVPEGNYVLAEKTAPEGYVKSNETYTLAVRNDNNHSALGWGGAPGVYFYNEDEPDYSNYKYIRYEQVTFVNKVKFVPTESDQIVVKVESNPDTGAFVAAEETESSNTMLAACLLSVCAFGVIGTVIYGKIKKSAK